MKIQRSERHNIARGHPMWKECDLLCLQAKNLYNYANYILRQQFIETGNITKYNDLTKKLKYEQVFKDIDNGVVKLQ